VETPFDLCTAAVKVISKTFNVLSVTIWLVHEHRQQLVPGASTSELPRDTGDTDAACWSSDQTIAALRRYSGPFDLEEVKEDWGEALRGISARQFQAGGHRICVPLLGGDRLQGLVILADRVNGVTYTVEELDLLKCIGDQTTAGLINLRLTNELVLARELEAFRTMSAFFVHDLKNAASALNLTLKNLPLHFDDPAFRADALRSIGNTARRIDDLIGRLSVLRQRPEFKPVESDLNQLVREAMESLRGKPELEFMEDLHPLPKILIDREQMRSVVTNLVLNAQDAMEGTGRIQVRTDHRDGRVVLSIADNGCGMSAAFMKDKLFRPFHSTKKKGLGIGMFQSRMIVEAHRGSIQAESETGKGSTFRISLPT
jgi:putative PEP-CTERM system histidine kinase